MPGLGMRFGYKPPRGLYPGLPMLIKAEGLKEIEEGMLYIGAGNPRLKLHAHPWLSPGYHVGPDGSAEFCVAVFSQRLAEEEWYARRLGRRKWPAYCLPNQMGATGVNRPNPAKWNDRGPMGPPGSKEVWGSL